MALSPSSKAVAVALFTPKPTARKTSAMKARNSGTATVDGKVAAISIHLVALRQVSTVRPVSLKVRMTWSPA